MYISSRTRSGVWTQLSRTASQVRTVTSCCTIPTRLTYLLAQCSLAVTKRSAWVSALLPQRFCGVKGAHSKGLHGAGHVTPSRYYYS